MQRLSSFGLLALLLVLSGCYHVRVETGLTPGDEVYEIQWAHSFIGGLVPPKVVEAQNECSSGVAIVESELSFLNMVAAAVTGGIYSPMHIKVTCASGSNAALMQEDGATRVSVARDADPDTVRQAFQAASEQAATTQQKVQVHFE